MKKFTALALSVLMVLSLCACAAQNTQAEETAAESQQVQAEAEEVPAEDEGSAYEDVYVIYTNDVHCGVDDNLGISSVATLKNSFEAAGLNVLLADCGDMIQGDNIGIFTQGEAIIDIANEAGYDIVIPGNHEFDYGGPRLAELVEKANYTYLSCNIKWPDGEMIFEPYKIYDIGGRKIAFLGVTTPNTIEESRLVKYYKDENGNIQFSFSAEEENEFFDQVQKYVDLVRSEGADKVVMLAHMGTGAESAPYTSYELVERTSGIDVVLDGHSHSTFADEEVYNKDGIAVPVSQTGTKMENIGLLKIAADGTITTSLVNDGNTSAVIAEKEEQLDNALDKVFAESDYKLCIYDPNEKTIDGSTIRIVRSQETNLADLITDAYRVAGDADIGISNGGGIRADLNEGMITYGDVLAVQPFLNNLCVVEIDGQSIIEALEHGAEYCPDENGGFLQVSGMSYTIDTTKEPGSRVSDVMVAGKPIELDSKYTVCGASFIVADGGDGFDTFRYNGRMVQKDFAFDVRAVIEYISEDLQGVIGEEYADPYGQGRIKIIK